MRNRRAPVQPVGTGRRAFIRAAFGSGSSAWTSLTSEQQLAWDSYASEHPITNSLGATVTLTGHQMYVAIYTQCVNCSIALPVVPPTDSSVWSPSAVEVEVSAAGDFDVTWSGGPGDGSKLLVAVSPPMSSGRRFPAAYWQAVAQGADAGEADIASAYQAQFGTLTAATRISVKVTPVNSEGVTGVPITVLATVGSPFRLVGAAVDGGGTGYSVGDQLSLDGGTVGAEGSAVVQVATETAGVITGLSGVHGGGYFVKPTNPVSTTPLTGTGSGATITVTWNA